MRFRFGKNMNFKIEITDFIERSSGGKLSLIKNNLSSDIKQKIK